MFIQDNLLLSEKASIKHLGSFFRILPIFMHFFLCVWFWFLIEYIVEKVDETWKLYCAY